MSSLLGFDGLHPNFGIGVGASFTEGRLGLGWSRSSSDELGLGLRDGRAGSQLCGSWDLDLDRLVVFLFISLDDYTDGKEYLPCLAEDC